MKVALAISSYDGDPAAAELVARAASPEVAGIFAKVAVVDSGDPDRCTELRRTLEVSGVDAHYLWHEGNLGSAGNLVERLRWGTSIGVDAVMAVNADGVLVTDNVRQMIDDMLTGDLAAVYPTHVIEGERVDLSGRRPVPVLPSREPLSRLAGKRAIDVRWGSSNGALYRLSALTSVDLAAIAAFWYGWEDLGIGIGLDAGGCRQVMSVQAKQPTRADQRHLGPTPLVVSSKAPWTTYYGVRNLILLGRLFPARLPRIILRLGREFVMILLRDRRGQRYRQALVGLRDGILGRTGQRVAPTA